MRARAAIRILLGLIVLVALAILLVPAQASLRVELHQEVRS
jgi:hypothetical protein